MNGTVEWTYGTYGTENGMFDRPYGVGMDSRGRYIVADFENKRIHLVSADGCFIGNLVSGLSARPTGVLVVANTV